MLALWIALAGAFGALARWALALGLQAVFGMGAPQGAFAANVLGCAAFGLVMQLANTGIIAPQTKLALLVGFLGAFTTFSTYVADVVALARDGQLVAAGVWVLAHNGLGVLAFLLGAGVGRQLV
ncbi:MAG: CrcB family protein [Planctomycetota bacterium]